VIVALSGRVPVKVTGKNGSIKAGDYITSSDIAGLGMKSTDAGQVVGQALNDFIATSTESVGVVMVFIKNQYYDGGDEYLQNSTSTVLADGSIADRFTHLFRRAFEKVTNIFLDMTLWIRNVKTDRVQTKELCIDDVCVTKDQLQQMLLNNSGSNSVSNSNVNNAIINNTPTSTVPTSTPPVVEDIIPENPTTTEPVVTPETIPPTEENTPVQIPETPVI
jgi:hypothetical protein